MLYEEVTGKILETCFEVSNELGAGFLENVYQNALLIALRQKGLNVKPQYPFTVVFRNETVGNYIADFLVEDKVIVEVKAVSTLTSEHQAQIINYLKASGVEVGLLVNFGTTHIQYKRVHKNLPPKK
ncbi:MAG: GxxExxY protein [Chloroflexi bacterium]|nr:GxxExxY protein [Chloroflexota bacterium]